MQAHGYLFHLYFFWLPSADMAVQRVARRVATGGHSIPEEVVRRRYARGLDNFFNQYAPAADSWVLMNNTARPAVRIAWRDVGGPTTIKDNRLWNLLAARYMKPRAEEETGPAYEKQEWTAEDIEAAVNRAVSAALKRHKERGESIVQWRDGKVVTIKPEDIEV